VSALERIAELHRQRVSTWDGSRFCNECSHDCACPTRRLCDEAEPLTLGDVERMGWNVAERLGEDVREARADADRLAAAMRAAMAGKPHTKFSELLAAHDAARAKEGL